MSPFLTLALWAGPALAAPEADPDWGRIVNGVEVTGDGFASAVAIGFDIPGYGQQSSCSASLITPRMLLTAAHCIEEVINGYGISDDMFIRVGAAFFGPNVNTGDVKTVKFADFTTHPDYGGAQQPENDIAVIVLAEDVGDVKGLKDVKPTWFAEKQLKDKVVGEDVISVGYGSLTTYNGPGSGVKRRVGMTIDRVDEQFLYSFAQTNPTNGNVCSGDSGGPQYHREDDGTLIQWGVHSFVFGGQNPCAVASGSTNVGTFGDWVLKRVEKEHGTTDRCELLGLYEDRTCDDSCVEIDVDCERDTDGDGYVSDIELSTATDTGSGGFGGSAGLSDDDDDDKDDITLSATCSHTGSTPFGLAFVGLAALALRRRRV